MRDSITKYEWLWMSIFFMITLVWTAVGIEMNVGVSSKRFFSYTLLYASVSNIIYGLFFYNKRVNRFKRKFKLRHVVRSGLALTVLICLFSIPLMYLNHLFIAPELFDIIKKNVVELGIGKETADVLINPFNIIWFYPLIYFVLGVVNTIIYSILFRIVFGAKKSTRRRKRLRKRTKQS